MHCQQFQARTLLDTLPAAKTTAPHLEANAFALPVADVHCALQKIRLH